MAVAGAALVTEEEFLSLPESLDKVELIDGEVFVSPSPRFAHQELLGRVVFSLRAWAKPLAGVTIGQSPLDVRLAPGRIVQPDAFVTLAELPLNTEGPLDRVPELCVEVLSARRSYDRLTKRLIYAEAGVRELWTIGQEGVFEIWRGAHLEECTRLEANGSVTTTLLPNFRLQLSELFQGLV
jgi:Uma2 family endonuclease